MSQVDVVLLSGGGLLALGLLLALALVVRSGRRRAAAERADLEEGLRRSREQVEALARRVEDLTSDVQSARRATVEDREYVITTLAEAAGATVARAEVPAPRPAVPLDVEQRVVEGLGRIDDRSALGRRVVDTGVGLLAAVHGVRRALRAEHLDRAAAEAHVARRRSRRLRRQELREAKRLLRAVKAQRLVRVEQEDAA